ncbi:hypothetical protein H6G35_27100 [Aulosira sp. FACHB-113]|nr:hypothetical protein [Aulosira sp. FACHB-113]
MENFTGAIAFITPSFHLRTGNFKLETGIFSFGTGNFEFRTRNLKMKNSTHKGMEFLGIGNWA